MHKEPSKTTLDSRKSESRDAIRRSNSRITMDQINTPPRSPSRQHLDARYSFPYIILREIFEKKISPLCVRSAETILIRWRGTRNSSSRRNLVATLRPIPILFPRREGTAWAKITGAGIINTSPRRKPVSSSATTTTTWSRSINREVSWRATIIATWSTSNRALSPSCLLLRPPTRHWTRPRPIITIIHETTPPPVLRSKCSRWALEFFILLDARYSSACDLREQICLLNGGGNEIRDESIAVTFPSPRNWKETRPIPRINYSAGDLERSLQTTSPWSL